MEKTFQKRLIAFKIDISTVNSSKFVKEEGWTPNYLQVGEQKISRVNIIGTVLDKNESGQNIRLTIDDGTGTISLVTFDANLKIDNIKVGDVILCIGKPREYGDEKYILPEMMKVIGNEWLKARKLELNRSKTNIGLKKTEEIKATVPNDGEFIETQELEDIFIDETSVSDVDEVVEIIKRLDNGDGTSIENIKSHTKKENIDKIVLSLLEQGEIFEIKPGMYKVLE